MTDLNWRVINDFTPGIISNISPNHPDGAANPDGTFRCYAIEGGSLAPLPRLAQTIRGPLEGSGETVLSDNYLPPPTDIISEEHRIIGLHAGGPVFSPDNTIGFAQDNTEIFVAFETWTPHPSTNDTQTISVYKYRRNWKNPQWELVRDDAYTIEPFNPFSNPVWGEFANTRSNNGNPDQAGPVITAFVSYGHAWFHPDDSNPGTNSTRNLPANNGDASLGGTLGAVNMVAHQGRIVLFPLRVEHAGPNAVWATNESMLWTAVNDARTPDPLLTNGYFNVLVGWENPAGYHVMESLSYDELLLIKSRGGAVVIRSSLNNFIAENFPYVRSTGFTNNRGTTTPRGFTYPVDGSGVWMWTGGQVSEFLTEHLDDDFWRVPLVAQGRTLSDGQTYKMGNLHYPTQATRWGDFVLYPNNWLWDTSRDPSEGALTAWWRIADPADPDDGGDGFTILRWSSDWRENRVYGTTTGIYSPSNPAIYEFDRQIAPSPTWRWLSHPLSDTLEREVDLQEVAIVASGKGSVHVRAFTATDPTGQSREFEVDGTSSRPTIQKLNFNVSGPQLAFDIRANADNPVNGAPVLHELRYGIVPGDQIAGG